MKFTDCIEIVGSKPTLYEGTKQYVSTGAVEEYFINEKSIEEYSYKERPSRADLVGKSGDILFAKMAETKKTLILDKETENYLFSTGFFAIRPKNGILTTKCLYYLLNSKNFLSQKDKNSSGATQKAITNAGLEKINVNIPLFSKQDQIVKQFDLLTDIIKKYQSQLKKLDSLIKSRFIEMFGDKPVESGKWKVEKLEDVCDLITDGTHKTPNYQQKGIRFISAKNIINGKIDLTDTKFITEEEYKQIQKRCRVEKNDVLLTKSGSLGSSAIIDFDIPIGLFESLAVIKYKRNLLNGIFVKELLSAESSQKQFNNGVKGIAIKHLHLNVIAALKIPIPPIELQNDFASFVQQIDKSKFTVQKSLEKAETLYKSLMQEYFA